MEVVAELQLQAARMAASCVRIHVVTKHEAGYRSALLVIDCFDLCS